MERYKKEVDALHASDTLRQSIADLPRQTPQKKKSGRHVGALVAVIAVVLAVSVIGVPSLFTATRKAGNAAYDSAVESKSISRGGSVYDNAAPELSEEAFYDVASASKTDALAANLPANRKLIRDAELRVETKQYDDFLSSVTTRLSALGGYVQSTDSSTNYNGSRYATLVFRIPADQLDSFLSYVSEIGTVTSQTTSVQDVTDDYIDLESRVKALETEQETLLGLLKKAEDLSDALEIQSRLSEVRASLESYKGKLKALDGQIDYSTVTVYLDEVERVTAPEGKTFLQQVYSNLSENLYNIGQGFRNFGIGFLSNLPYIFLWLFFIGVIVLIVVRIVRKRRRR